MIWKRKPWHWRYEFSYIVSDSRGNLKVTRYLGFVSYWMIRWIHGEKILQEMGKA